MADNLTQVLSNYIIYVDSSSLMHGNMEFFKISLFNVLKSTKRQIKLPDFVIKELKKKQFSDSERFAVKALNIIDYYRRAGLVEDVVTSGAENGKILDVIYNNRNVDKDDVCVITENKDLANEIVTNLSARKGIDFDYKIAAVRLINGPALWNIKTVKPRVMPIKREEKIEDVEAPTYERTSTLKRPTFNSPSIDEVKIDPIPQIDDDYDSPYDSRDYETPEYKRESYSYGSYGSYDSKKEEPKKETPRSYGSYGKTEKKKETPRSYGAPSYASRTRSEPTVPVRETRREERRQEPRHEEPSRNTYQEPPRREERRQEPPRREVRYEEPRREERPPQRRPIPQPEPKREEPFRPVNNSRMKRSKLVVSIVVDNSTSLDDHRSALMKDALNNFYNQVKTSNIKGDLDLAVYGFDGFSPRVIKGYDGELDINRFDNGGIQVLGKTIELAMDELVERQKLYQAHNIETHKPWLIVLTDGGAYGDLDSQVSKLKKVIRNKKLTYFPFCLSEYPMDPSMDSLAKLKMFLKIRDNKFSNLFNFLYNTLAQRINTPDEVNMKLDRQALKGFIAR